MGSAAIVRRGTPGYDDWREVVWRDTGKCIGWLQRDTWGSLVAWDAYDLDRKYLSGFGNLTDATRYLIRRAR